MSKERIFSNHWVAPWAPIFTFEPVLLKAKNTSYKISKIFWMNSIHPIIISSTFMNDEFYSIPLLLCFRNECEDFIYGISFAKGRHMLAAIQKSVERKEYLPSRIISNLLLKGHSQQTFRWRQSKPGSHLDSSTIKCYYCVLLLECWKKK